MAILTPKTGLLIVFFTEKWYRSINIGYITSNNRFMVFNSERVYFCPKTLPD